MSRKLTILFVLFALLCLVSADEGKAADKKNADDELEQPPLKEETARIQKWMTPNAATGFGTMFFLTIMALFGFSLLSSITVPNFQLKSKVEGEDAKEWTTLIWGNIEK